MVQADVALHSHSTAYNSGLIARFRHAGAVSSPQSGGFGAAAAQSTPAFGSGGVFAPPAAAAAPSLFGASPAFGAAPTQTSPFSQPAAVGGFGIPATPSSTGAFGSVGGFGQAAVMGGAGFGQAATPGSGQQPAAGAFGAAPFGSPASPNLQQPSPGNHSPLHALPDYFTNACQRTRDPTLCWVIHACTQAASGALRRPAVSRAVLASRGSPTRAAALPRRPIRVVGSVQRHSREVHSVHKEAKASEALHSPRPRVSRPRDLGHFGLPGNEIRFLVRLITDSVQPT